MASRKPTPKGMRWSAWRAALELGVTTDKIKKGLAAHGISPGADGHYSTGEIMTALYGKHGLEQKAREARWHRIIAEAEIKMARRDALREQLIDRVVARQVLEESHARTWAVLEDSPLSEKEKKQLAERLEPVIANMRKTFWLSDERKKN